MTFIDTTHHTFDNILQLVRSGVVTVKEAREILFGPSAPSGDRV